MQLWLRQCGVCIVGVEFNPHFLRIQCGVIPSSPPREEHSLYSTGIGLFLEATRITITQDRLLF